MAEPRSVLAVEADKWSPTLEQKMRKKSRFTPNENQITELRNIIAKSLDSYWKKNPHVREKLRQFVGDRRFTPHMIAVNGPTTLPWKRLPWHHIRAIIGWLELPLAQVLEASLEDESGKQLYEQRVKTLQWLCSKTT